MLYRFFLRLAAASAIFIFVPAQAQTNTISSSVQKRQSDSSIPRLSNLNQPATTVDEWISQIAQTSVVQITGVRLNATEAGLEIVLETFREYLNIKNLFDIDYFRYSQESLRVFPGDPLTVQGTISWQF